MLIRIDHFCRELMRNPDFPLAQPMLQTPVPRQNTLRLSNQVYKPNPNSFCPRAKLIACYVMHSPSDRRDSAPIPGPATSSIVLPSAVSCHNIDAWNRFKQDGVNVLAITHNSESNTARY